MKKNTVRFYFDYISPFAYLASVRLQVLQAQLDFDIDYQPVLFAGLLNHWGHKGPAEIPPKREFIFKECLRFAARNDIPFNGVPFHPFVPLHALRVTLPEACGLDNQIQVMRALWHGGWAESRDLADPKVVVALLDEADLPGAEIVEKSHDPAIKALLKTRTDEAITAGVFGVPFMIVNETEHFWGNDDLESMADWIRKDDPLDREKLAEILARPRAAERIKS